MTTAAAGRGAVDDLAAKHIDPIKGHSEKFKPPLLHIYRQRPVVLAAVAAGRLESERQLAAVSR
jgi:hypothetical protein